MEYYDSNLYIYALLFILFYSHNRMRIKWSSSNEIFRVSSGAGDDDDDDDITVRFDVVVFAFGCVQLNTFPLQGRSAGAVAVVEVTCGVFVLLRVCRIVFCGNRGRP